MTTYSYGRSPAIKDSIARAGNTSQDTTIASLLAAMGDYTAYDSIADASGNILMDGSVGFYQKVTITGASSHTLNLTNFTKIGTYFLAVTQHASGTGTLIIPGTVANTTGITTYTIATKDGTAAFTSPLTLVASGVYAYAIIVTPTNISILGGNKIA